MLLQCFYIQLLLIVGNEANLFIFLPHTQSIMPDESDNCEKMATGDQSGSGPCSGMKSYLTGSIKSGLLNEITDNDVITPRPSFDDAAFQHASSAITDFLERLPQTGYDNRLRPNLHGKRVSISCSMYIGGISAVSESNMDFTADIYFRQAWNDHRLKFNSSHLGEHESLNIGGDFIDFLWRPDTYIPNAKLALYHRVTRHNAFVRIMPQGHVHQSIRITVTAACPMDFRLFPMDSQRCDIKIESFALPSTDVVYRWGHLFTDSENKQDESSTASTEQPPPISIIADATSLPQFTIRGFRALETFVERIEGRNHSRLVVEIYFQRSLGYYLIQIYLPASLVVVISWVSFWVPRHSQPARVSLGVTTVLTLTMMTGQGISTLPKISYLKALDLFMIVCFSLVFLALIEYALVSYADKRASQYTKMRQDNEDDNGMSLNCGVAEQLLRAIPNSPLLISHSPLLHRRLVSFATPPLIKIERNYYDDDDREDETAGCSLYFPPSLPARIEGISRIVFPLSFFIFNICYWNYFLKNQKITTSENTPGFIEYNH